MIAPLAVGELDVAAGTGSTGIDGDLFRKIHSRKAQLSPEIINAYVKGCKYFSERGMKNEEVLQILEKYTKIPAETLKAYIPVYIDKGGMINVKSVEEMQDWLYNNGYMKNKVPMGKVLDLSFLK